VGALATLGVLLAFAAQALIRNQNENEQERLRQQQALEDFNRNYKPIDVAQKEGEDLLKQASQEAAAASIFGTYDGTFEETQKRITGLYVKACELGKAEGCEAAAKAYAEGHGVGPDPARALALRRTACVVRGGTGCEDLAK
jgi:hypothetical protein